jgi:inorganic triphosphatase YgiF
LQPVFRTEIQRSWRLLRPDECSIIEAAFDEGRIIAAPVSEMELELKSGYAHSLYRLALDLLADVPLALETASKADRGFLLSSDKAPEASKASHISIDSSASTANAFRLVVSLQYRVPFRAVPAQAGPSVSRPMQGLAGTAWRDQRRCHDARLIRAIAPRSRGS